MIDIKNNYLNKTNINTVTDNSTTSVLSKKDKIDDKIRSTENVLSTDTVSISDKSKNLTNAQKVKKALDDTCKDSKFKYFIFNGMKMDASCVIGEISEIMECYHIHPVPSDILSSNNSDNKYSFLDFVDKMKEFAKKNSDRLKIPDNFFDFCDKLKQNMILNGVQ